MAKTNAEPSETDRPRPPAYQPLVLVLTAVAGGILFDSVWPLQLWCWACLAVVCLAAWAGIAWRSFRRMEEAASGNVRPATSAVLAIGSFTVLLAVAAAAGAWHHCRWSLCGDDDLGRYARLKRVPVCVEAIALGSPRQMPRAAFDPMQGIPRNEEISRLAVDLVTLRNGSTWQSVSGRATLLVIGPRPQLMAGDRMRCFVQLSVPSGPRNPGGFDLAARDRGEGILSGLQAEVPECLSVTESGRWLSVTRLLDTVRMQSNRLLESYVDPGHAEMAEAVLLGEREQLEPGRIENFMATGVVHLLVIAGLHVGILAGALFWLLRRTPLSQAWAAGVVAVATLFYMLLVDAGPPVVRAAVLVLITCLGICLGRRGFSFNSLAAAAIVVLIINPNHLFHAGAQLSFLSVAGLMWLAPRWLRTQNDPLDRLIERNLTWMGRLFWGVRRGLRHMAIVSLVIALLTTPLVMARFHLCTPVAILLNTIVWLPMAIGLVSGAALLVVAGVVPPLGHLCGGLCNLNFGLLEGCVTVARRIPCGHFWLPGPADWWLWGFYGGLAILAAFPRLRPPRRWRLALVAAWITVGVCASNWRHDPNRLECTFLSMGHGCAVLLELPSGQTLLYDAGQSGAPKAGSRAVSGFLWSRGIMHLDAVVLSHPDLDHYNAVPELLERFSVGVVYVSPMMFEKQNQSMAALRAAIERHGVPIRTVRGGDRLRGGERCRLEVLHPPRRPSLPDMMASDNSNSLVLAVEAFGRRVLLAGDLESPGLDDVLAEEPERCDVLLAPHHGSRRSNSPKLAAWCRPRWVVLSGDGRSALPEIEATFRAVGSQVFHTHLGGAIQVRITGDDAKVTPFVQPQ
ncbi:MAG: ComEC/Rec2 family competence protein [Thermoguttaceae bacterium]